MVSVVLSSLDASDGDALGKRFTIHPLRSVSVISELRGRLAVCDGVA
jgi:hypothetical protein